MGPQPRFGDRCAARWTPGLNTDRWAADARGYGTDDEAIAGAGSDLGTRTVRGPGHAAAPSHHRSPAPPPPRIAARHHRKYGSAGPRPQPTTSPRARAGAHRVASPLSGMRRPGRRRPQWGLSRGPPARSSRRPCGRGDGARHRPSRRARALGLPHRTARVGGARRGGCERRRTPRCRRQRPGATRGPPDERTGIRSVRRHHRGRERRVAAAGTALPGRHGRRTGPPTAARRVATRPAGGRAGCGPTITAAFPLLPHTASSAPPSRRHRRCLRRTECAGRAGGTDDGALAIGPGLRP